MEARTRGAALVPGAHRVIRQLEPGEGPYAGVLVTRGGSVAVQIDAAVISGWAGWQHAGDEHVAGPLDIVRRHDGHDVLLPWCTERISVFLGRRAAADVPVASGEVATLIASVLRALGELAERGDQADDGEWWLTDDGRPMFVIGEGDDARTGATRLIERLQRDCADRAVARLLAAIRDGIHKSAARPGVPARQLERWESDLFAIAASRPLRLDAHAPERARDLDVARRVLSPPESRREVRAGAHGESDQPAAAVRLSRAITEVRFRMSAVRTAVERWAQRPRAARLQRPRRLRKESVSPSEVRDAEKRAPVRRGRMLLVAGLAALAVLGGGLLWPGGATGEPEQPGPQEPASAGTDVAGEQSTSPSPSPSPSPDAKSDAKSEESSRTEDPVVAARELLATVDRCAEAEDLRCAEAVADGSAGIVEALTRSDPEGGERSITPVDAYGDIAVIRVASPVAGDGEDAPGAREQMVVLVRIAEKWLVRDAYDVADQPG